MHHLLVLLSISCVQLLPMGQKVLLIDEVCLPKSWLLLVSKLVLLPSRHLHHWIMRVRVVTLFVIIARASIMWVYVCVPVKWHLVLRGVVCVYFIYNQRAEHRVLLLSLRLNGCLLSNLSCVSDSHSLVCLHWDRISSLNPHPYPI